MSNNTNLGYRKGMATDRYQLWDPYRGQFGMWIKFDANDNEVGSSPSKFKYVRVGK